MLRYNKANIYARVEGELLKEEIPPQLSSSKMRTLLFTVTEETAGRTVKSLLLYRLHLPQSRIASLKTRETGIMRNGVRCCTTERVAAGDVLTVEIGDLPKESGIIPVPVELEIPWEDEDLLILNKPAGMATHAMPGVPEYSVPNALAAYLGTDALFHIVNRLDKGTSGLMVIAKNGYSHDRLRCALHTDAFVREYLAICSGVFPGNVSVTLPVDGKPARTDFILLGQKNSLSLVRARLTTGRHHQIRAHCASLGCPLLGDGEFGGDIMLLGRPALHSAYLSLVHPVTGERITCSSDLPEELHEKYDQSKTL